MPKEERATSVEGIVPHRRTELDRTLYNHTKAKEHCRAK